MPFIADSANAVALKHIQEKPIPPIDLNGEVPRRLNNIILKAMEKEREHRFQSCNEMREELDKLLDPNIEDVPEEPATNKTGVRTTTFDLSQLNASAEDDDFRKEEYDETTNYTGMTTRKLVSKPPVALVGFIRSIIIIALCSLFFLALFYIYGKMTNVHFKLATSPAGAKIFINKSLIGTSPVDLELAPAQFLVSLQCDGYETDNRLIDGPSGGSIDLSVKLRKIDKEAEAKINSTLENLKKNISSLSKLSNSKSKKDQAAQAKLNEECLTLYDSIYQIFESHDYEFDYGIAYINASKSFNKLNDAKNNISNLITKGNDTADLHCLLALLYKELDDKEHYKESLNDAYLKDPNNRHVLNSYGKYYIDSGEKQVGKQYLVMSLFLYPDQPDIKAINDKL